jgi:hypothetical protein
MSPKNKGVPPPVSEKEGYVLHPDLLNPRLLEAQYAVRGELYLKAEELKKQGEQIIYTNGEDTISHAPQSCSLGEGAGGGRGLEVGVLQDQLGCQRHAALQMCLQ